MISMEEEQAGKVAREANRGTSEGNDQNIEKDEELSIVIQGEAVRYNLSSSIIQKLKYLDDVLIEEKADHQERAAKPMIQKVPAMLREKENLKMCFEPFAVSIGPYHHENLNLKVKEEMKLKLAAMFMKEHVVDKKNLYVQIRMEIEELRRCYEPESTERYDDDELAWMFLVDGCVVLHFTYVSVKYLNSNKIKRYEIVQGITDRYTFGTDLLLLENQLPYHVLKLIISSSKDGEGLKKSILWFISRKTNVQVEENQELPLENPAHLLDLTRTSFIFQSASNKKKSSFIVQILEQSIKIMGKLFDILPCLTGALLDHILPPQHYTIFQFHNIEELKEAGIELKPNNTGRLTDINFNHGTLKLPRIVVGQDTWKKFFNLIAYEMCPNFHNNFEVSNSVFFLASLIARAQDTKELQVNKILYSKFDGDEEVVKLFKEIGNNSKLVPHDAYYSILEQIQEYCNKKHNTWKAQLRIRYFESPWSVIALVGAIIAISVTILQTVYTVLAYYKQETATISNRIPP